MQQEEILIKLGVNHSQLKTGLTESERAVVGWAEHIGDKLKHAFLFHEALSLLKEAFKETFISITEEIYAHIYKYEKADEIIFDAQRRAFRKTREEVEKIDKVEAERNKKAAETSERIQGIERSLRSVRELNDLIAKGWGSESSVYRQKAIQLALEEEARLGEIIADASTTYEDRQKASLKLEETRRDRLKETIALKQDADEQELEKAKAIAAQRKLALDLDKQIAQTKKEQAGMKFADIQPFMPSLQELAQSSFMGWRGNRISGSGRFAGMASDILDMGDFAKLQVEAGNIEGARATVRRRNDRYDELATAGILPPRQEKGVEAQIETAAHLKSLTEQRKAIKVAPVMGGSSKG